jgi:cytochrome c-type biogenesis protein CcmF
MNYNGEHLFYGQLGHFLSLVSLIAALAAAIAYFVANKQTETTLKTSWTKLARIFFATQTVATISIFGLLLFLVNNHYHEYFFAWNHSSRSLSKEYLLSCLWEDQSGSFLLWAIWNSVLGWIFIAKQKKWEAPVLTVISFAQFCIATMIIGIYVFGTKIGNNPFALLRNELDAPVLFQNADYLNFPKIFEGNDLNALLQNYWMVIHPPILFLGFASTIIPFAFAYSGLINNDKSWTIPALKWTAFSVGILGLGIMMGAAWAYESLSFGGYWAWDPVENASLVPWITLVAGLHTNLIFKSTGYSLRSTYFFYIISFSLILYSTFLTRSGILGDTSVHAFTGADMTLQLLLYMLVFLVPLLYLFFKNYKKIESITKEEETYSREFWMFVGSLVLMLSAAVITFKTSIPVYNKIFGTKIAPPEEPEFAHNQVQVFVAIVLGFLTATTQYLKYKNTAASTFFKSILLPTIIALVASIAISVFGNVSFNKFGIAFLIAIHIAIFSSIYAVVANFLYIITALKSNVKFAGASVAHIGFGLVLVGILISSSKKAVLSWNTTGISVFKKSKQEDPAENITLFKGLKTDMGKYSVTYLQDSASVVEKKKYFKLLFQDKATNETFYLYPDALKANKGNEGFSFNPDKKHYWNRDIFVYVSSFTENKIEDTATFRNIVVAKGDTMFYANGLLILDSISKNIKTLHPTAEAGFVMNFSVFAKNGTRTLLQPAVILKSGEAKILPDTALSQGLVIKFNKINDVTNNKFEVGIKESASISELLTLKVYEFPMINILWIGIVVMVIGCAMSVWKRVVVQKK